jgi:hypothetical protein
MDFSKRAEPGCEPSRTILKKPSQAASRAGQNLKKPSQAAEPGKNSQSRAESGAKPRQRVKLENLGGEKRFLLKANSLRKVRKKYGKY